MKIRKRAGSALFLTLPVVLLLLSQAAPLVAQSFTVRLKVLAPDQTPVVRAEAALLWEIKDGAFVPREVFVTDESGVAQLRIDDWKEARPVLVFSADRQLGGFIGASREDEGSELTLTLSRTVKVKGSVTSSESGARPASVITTVRAEDFRAPFIQNISGTASLAFILPSGLYHFEIHGTDLLDFQKTVLIEAGREEHDLGAIDMELTKIARMKGTTPPDWSVTEARGLNAGARLGDFKGKWVLLEFWGFW